MKNIYSNIFSFNKKILLKSIANLEKGNVVGLPTETVYGLAGNAYFEKALTTKDALKWGKRPDYENRFRDFTEWTETFFGLY